ncbi:P-II family nitrogen regulator [Thiomicrorhabdus sp. zzn3]|uniref:P-II family nitrogen regulator n=1 Tax=Thiomicrorhabdus sp. zzn3 TaxID=3039775 RepID=UPI002436DD76|nr:P-II family nitrogen regulator [Thiomicrorhabdus sp. zzn3]MDG6778251.1 P-II family nitrogen regulator [Thiomicrorhabdus sp. zzn3]
MKIIQAIINPYALDNVREALSELGEFGMTATEVKGYGRQKGHTETYRGTEYEISYVPKIMIEIAASDDQVDDIVQCIIGGAKSEKIGAGKIFILPLEEVVRVRTSETGDSAI